MSQNIVMKFGKIAYNVAIPENQFALPAAVKELVERKKQQGK
jgi:hypothetical protein